ncbi:hypothetical protein LAZ67_1005076 [Cordylochernes scorpioides]|uniref:Uncharacterized protein n=1 Tax=Cordylochernes scorpioides TaxID=51811 RepID=A0ABY6JZP5_9ARAC|nr:hypothetical protein LAZ67_1005076 [Cordylochernes scorpioides]
MRRPTASQWCAPTAAMAFTVKAECFKGSWNHHKLLHKPADEVEDTTNWDHYSVSGNYKDIASSHSSDCN